MFIYDSEEINEACLIKRKFAETKLYLLFNK